MTLKLQTCLSIVLIFICQASAGQADKRTAVLEKKYIIPFRLTAYNNLSVQAILNKKDTVNLMFHTATNALHLTEDAVKKIQSVRFDRTDSGVKSWGGGGNTSRCSKSNLLEIGDLSWDSIPLWEDKYSGHFTDGKFGPNLFENKVVEIDFDKQVIIVSNSLPPKTKKYEKLKLFFDHDNMFIESAFTIADSTYNKKFLIHSGYSGAVMFDDQFGNESKIGEKLKIIHETEMKDAFGNVLISQQVMLPQFKLGNEKLDQVPAGIWKGAIGRQKMSFIGGDILKRFNIIIDAQRQYIYLKANHSKKANYLNV
jgi:hypothetical protein